MNDAPLVSGATLYAGDRVNVGEKAAASLQLPGGMVLAGPGSRLSVQPAGVRLESGLIQARQKAGASLAIEADYFRVRLVPAGDKPAAAEVSINKDEGRVIPMSGMADIVAAGGEDFARVTSGEAALVKWGETSKLPAAQVTGGKTAGQVSRLLPAVNILRGANRWTAAAQAPVEWNDELRSNRGGRARVALHDGSTLNLGSESSLRVQRHDPGAQQTELELSIGRLRSRVVRQARSGAKFEVRTPVASAGVVGTDFYLANEARGTVLIVFDGEVKLTSLISGQTLLAITGQKIVVTADGAMSGPVQATLEEIREAKNSTNVPEEQARDRKAPPLPLIIMMVGGVAAGTGLAVWLSHREPGSPATP